MKRYQSIQFREMVQRPEQYLGLLLEKLDSIISKLWKKDHSAPSICRQLNELFESDKIKFEFKPESKEENIILKGHYNVDTFYIVLFCGFNLEKIQYTKEDIEDFIEDFTEVVGHELIHRLQYVNDKVKEARAYNLSDTKELLKYLSNPKEIMAHAWQIVQSFKLLGFYRELIYQVINNRNNKIINIIYILNMYRNHFDSNSEVWKRLLKYIYQYAE